MTRSRASLAARVRAFIDGALANRPTEPFDQLARDIHGWQAANDPVVAALAAAPPTTWRDIPAVPVLLFKHLDVGTVSPNDPHRAFHTSGTTDGRPGIHRIRTADLYEYGAVPWARHCVPNMPDEVVGLLPDPAVVTTSSLAHMVGAFTTEDSPPATWHVHDGALDLAGLTARLANQTAPIFLGATAFALAEWLEHGASPLPEGSVVMVTGGFKGRVSRLDGAGLYDAARQVLRPERLVTEYGMTELSSQLWGTPGAPFVPPAWLRVVAVDPSSGEAQAPEQRGQLRFYDLANLDSTLAIETLDEGIVHADGTVTLFGRLPGASLRGCSLTTEAAWRGESA